MIFTFLNLLDFTSINQLYGEEFPRKSNGEGDS